MDRFDPILELLGPPAWAPIRTSIVQLIRWMGPLLGLSLLGTILTVAAFWFRRPLLAGYEGIKARWRRMRGHLPAWMHPLLRIGVGLLGVSLIVTGIPVIPLPGPGNLLILAGAALLDLEFDWAVPCLDWFLQRWPDRWTPERIHKRIQRLDHRSK